MLGGDEQAVTSNQQDFSIRSEEILPGRGVAPVPGLVHREWFHSRWIAPVTGMHDQPAGCVQFLSLQVHSHPLGVETFSGRTRPGPARKWTEASQRNRRFSLRESRPGGELHCRQSPGREVETFFGMAPHH
jgi:hypothetical protein